MSRQNWSVGQVITSDDLNALSMGVEQTILEQVLQNLLQGNTGFVTDAFKIVRVTGTTFTCTGGLGLYLDSSQSSPETEFRLLHNLIPSTIYTITNPHATLARIDIVQVRFKIENEVTASRDIKDGAGTVAAATVPIRKKWTFELQIKDGTASGSPTAPSPDSGWVKIATLAITAVTGMVNSGAVTDNRTVLQLFDEIKARATALEGRATTLESRATSLEGRATSLESRATSLEGRATSLESRATTLEAKFTTGSFSFSSTGGFAVATAGGSWVKNGPIVTLSISSIYSTSSGTGIRLTGLPAGIIPVMGSDHPFFNGYDNGAVTGVLGVITLYSGQNYLDIFKTIAKTNIWTASGTKGWDTFTITYRVA